MIRRHRARAPLCHADPADARRRHFGAVATPLAIIRAYTLLIAFLLARRHAAAICRHA